MVMTTITKVYGVDDIKLFPISADDATTYTLGTAIDLPGAKQITMDFTVDKKELTGDEKILDIISKCKGATFSVDYAKLSLDVMALITGATVVTSGTGSTEVNTVSVMEGMQSKYFQLQAQILTTDVDGGDLIFILFKCKASMPMGGNEADFSKLSLSGDAAFTTKPFTRSYGTKAILMETKLRKTTAALVGVST